MKIAFQLAYRNLMGAGLKTWLNVGILAFTFILIVFQNGFMDGWNKQAVLASMEWEYGIGQVYSENYDPMDPFTILDGHSDISTMESEHLEPILIRQATVYPGGRMVSILLKGISADQQLLALPTAKLKEASASIPAIIGQKFSKSNNLKLGDEVLVRWRDKNGTFDASNITIVDIFETDVASVDAGQVWIDLAKLQSLSGLDGRATLFVASPEFDTKTATGWSWHSKDELLKGLYEVIATKKIGGSIMYVLLLSIALLAIFDTQVLSVFRRQKEIGTYISLGMTRSQVVKLFTVEGAMYSIMASGVAFVIGIPLLGLAASKGIPIPEVSASAGLNMSPIIYPYFGLGLILITLLLVVSAATIVSFMPARKIAKMDPVNALKGKIQ